MARGHLISVARERQTAEYIKSIVAGTVPDSNLIVAYNEKTKIWEISIEGDIDTAFEAMNGICQYFCNALDYTNLQGKKEKKDKLSSDTVVGMMLKKENERKKKAGKIHHERRKYYLSVIKKFISKIRKI